MSFEIIVALIGALITALLTGLLFQDYLLPRKKAHVRTEYHLTVRSPDGNVHEVTLRPDDPEGIRQFLDQETAARKDFEASIQTPRSDSGPSVAHRLR